MCGELYSSGPTTSIPDTLDPVASYCLQVSSLYKIELILTSTDFVKQPMWIGNHGIFVFL